MTNSDLQFETARNNLQGKIRLNTGMAEIYKLTIIKMNNALSKV